MKTENQDFNSNEEIIEGILAIEGETEETLKLREFMIKTAEEKDKKFQEFLRRLKEELSRKSFNWLEQQEIINCLAGKELWK